MRREIKKGTKIKFKASAKRPNEGFALCSEGSITIVTNEKVTLKSIREEIATSWLEEINTPRTYDRYTLSDIKVVLN